MRRLLIALTAIQPSLLLGQVTVEAPASATAGATIEVDWTGGGDRNDFITIVAADTDEGVYSDYAYARNPPVEMLVPDEPGEYELRYLGKDRPFPTLSRVALTVTPASASLQIPAAVDAGADVTISWQGPDNRGDFITIVAGGTPERQYGPYVYTNRGNPATLRAPDEAGEYEIRYLSGQEYYTLAAAPISVGAASASLAFDETVTAGSQFEVSWQGPDNAQDWIGVFASGAPDDGQISYKYTARGLRLTLSAPDEPGEYDVRYMTGQSDTALVSMPLSVVAVTAMLEAPAQVTGGTVFDAIWSGPDNRGDFVGIIAAGADAQTRYVDYAYTWRGTPASLIAPLQPGDYELRYATGQSGRVLATAALRVTPPASAPGTLTVVPGQDAPALTLGPDDAVELILDASGSMLQRHDGQRRIDIAKRVLQQLTSETIPVGTAFALRVFGHREADSCRTDLEIPLRPLAAAQAVATIDSIEAMNLARTPIARSLELVAEDLAAVRGSRLVVLITDGEETCEGNAAEVIERLKAAGFDVRVDIVGFAIDDAALADTFRYWAELGDGSYHEASDAAGLAASLSAALQMPFDVLNESGDRVAQGLVGGDSLELPAGDYSVRLHSNADLLPVTIDSDAQVRLVVPP